MNGLQSLEKPQPSDPSIYLRKPDLAPGEVLDFEHPAVRNFAENALAQIPDDSRSIAVRLFYAVRDDIFYEIFDTDLGPELSASGTVKAKRGFCLHKAILYAAACRSKGLPCRIVASAVRNHVTSDRIQRLVGGDVFLHWFNEVLIDGEWLRAAPVFNRLTCMLHGIEPLEFDGRRSAAVQPYVGDTAMEYLGKPMRFTHPTRSDLIDLVRRFHPNMITANGRVPAESSV